MSVAPFALSFVIFIIISQSRFLSQPFFATFVVLRVVFPNQSRTHHHHHNHLIDRCRVVNTLTGSGDPHTVDAASCQVSKPDLIIMMVLLMLMFKTMIMMLKMMISILMMRMMRMTAMIKPLRCPQFFELCQMMYCEGFPVEYQNII